MRIIFSRKGFDDAYGKASNLILPNGELVIFPIPELSPFKGIPYPEIYSQKRSLASYLKELKIDLPPAHSGAHLDPDLLEHSLPRKKGWRPLFGSHSAANSHLKNEGVGAGDLFLFFGSFRFTSFSDDGKLRYNAVPPVHLIFGWMKVEKRIDLDEKTILPQWAQYHAHVINPFNKSNSLYVSALRKDGSHDAGILNFRRDRILTRGGYRKSQWWLPHYFHPDSGTRISRHGNSSRFHVRPSRIMLNTVSIGQDFVVTSTDKRVTEWALSRIN